MSCHFVPLDGFVSQVEKFGDTLTITDTDELLELLPEYDDWTTLSITDGKVMEVVKAKNHCGRLVLERGFEDTNKVKFSCGVCVQFIMTKAGVEAMACCDKWFDDCKKEV